MFIVKHIDSLASVKKVPCVSFKFLTLSDFIKESKPLCLKLSHIKERKRKRQVGHSTSAPHVMRGYGTGILAQNEPLQTIGSFIEHRQSFCVHMCC